MQFEVTVGNNRKGDRVNDAEIINRFIVVGYRYAENFDSAAGFWVGLDLSVEFIVGFRLSDTVWAVDIKYFDQDNVSFDLAEGERLVVGKPQVGTLSGSERSGQGNFWKQLAGVDWFGGPQIGCKQHSE